MKVPADKLLHLFKTHKNAVSGVYLFGDVVIKGKHFRSGDSLREEDLRFMVEKNYGEVEILYRDKIYSLLWEEFPGEFRKPYRTMDYISMDRHLETLQSISMQTRRKRNTLVVGDFYGYDSASGKRIIAATHGEMMDYKKWTSMRRSIDKDQHFSYRNSECAIILFVNMTPDADGNYVERFKKNMDLVAAMVTPKRDMNVIIAPDFIPTEDVVSVNDPGRLLDVYRETSARLIIIGESLSESYRDSLLKVKQYDKYVRIMVVPSIDTTNLNHFLSQVKLVYNSNRWEE